MYRLILLLTVFNSYSQNSIMVPKSGTIIFRRDQIIFDNQSFEQSTKELSKKMIVTMKNDCNLSDESFNEIEYFKSANLYQDFFGNSFETYKFYNTFKGEKIEYWYSIDDEIQNDTIVFQIDNLPLQFESHHRNSEFLYPIVRILNINEFRDENKDIEGYPCFKVEFTYSEKYSEDDWKCFRNNLTQRMELWVTEKIKANFHPVLNSAEILEKYYPLEIIEYTDELKGVQVVYKVEKISLSN